MNKVYECQKSGIIVYPINKDGHWFLNIENNGKIIKGTKKIAYGNSKGASKLINDAMEETYLYFWNKLNKKSK